MAQSPSPSRWTRRGWFAATGAALAATAAHPLRAGDRPQGAPPEISGDRALIPWDERLTITVGPDPAKADIAGTSEKAIQAAVDAVARLGGGTVRILPGTYRLRNSVYLASNLRLVGAGLDTILIKEPSVSTALDANADWYDQEITLADPSGFRVGDGVCLRAKDTHTGGPTVIKRTLVGRSGNRFRLDRDLRENLWVAGTPTAATLFPILSGDHVENVVIEDLALDGNKGQNENLDGNYSGCIFLQDCRSFDIRRVTGRNQNGDGFSWQICHDVLVEDCHSHDNVGLGFHPGSGSQRPIMRRNRSERNDLGIFFCWGVRFGIAEDNTIVDNKSYGVSIGHRDTDNIVRRNTITGSGKVGVLFRDEIEAFAGHRNLIEANTIIDSGGPEAAAIDVMGQTSGVRLVGNTLRETRGSASRIGIRVGPRVRDLSLDGNQFEGFATDVVRMPSA